VKKNISYLPVFLAVIIVLCGCSIVFLGGIYYTIHKIVGAVPTISANIPNFDGRTPTPFELTRQAADRIPVDSKTLLAETIIPSSNQEELACRFRHICGVASTLPAQQEPYTIGARKPFWINNEDSHSFSQIQGILVYKTDHAYFWVKEGIHFNDRDVRKLVDAFENKIYPTDRQYFGSEWTPGVDNDIHIYILYTDGLGSSVAGYYYSSDEYNPLVRQYSNAHEMFYINSTQALRASYTYGSLAHEFQHMIHWYQDRNESAFLNEGFSEIASFLNGYTTGVFDRYFLIDPDLNLTDWLGSTSENGAHYGASFLFTLYFLDRFGESATRALIQDQHNGLDSIDSTLSMRNAVDPSSRKLITADDFFVDWAITNYLQDNSVGDGRYVYHNYPSAPKASPTETITSCPVDNATRTVNQYGVDYIQVRCQGEYSLHFEGATSTRLFPADPHSGNYVFWSNKGDNSDMTLTHEFDLTGVSSPITMEYWAWFDVEKDFDYVFVEASTDGKHWSILPTPSGTAVNPNGASFGWGYTGNSTGWIKESIDLSAYADKITYIRFEYITDQAVNGEGFLLEDVSIPALQYFDDIETNDPSWQTAGFVRVENTIPQTFSLALITHSQNSTKVQSISLNTDQSTVIPLNVGQNGTTDVVLIVSGTVRFTRMVAPYRFSIINSQR
jgi:immune inhibitor A